MVYASLYYDDEGGHMHVTRNWVLLYFGRPLKSGPSAGSSSIRLTRLQAASLLRAVYRKNQITRVIRTLR